MSSSTASSVEEPSSATEGTENSTTTTTDTNTNTATSLTNAEMESNNTLNKIAIESENRERPARQIDRSNNNDWWWEIENEDFTLDLTPPIMTETVTMEVQSKPTTTIAVTETATTTTTTTTATETTIEAIPSTTTVESVTSRLLRKRDELAKKYGIGEEKVENAGKDEKFNLLKEKEDIVETVKEQSLDEFKEELRVKRLARQTAVQDLRNEIHSLRNRLAQAGIDSEPTGKLDKLTIDLTVKSTSSADANEDADDVDPLSRSRHANIELANAQLALQMANAENLTLHTELGVLQKQVFTLKEVISCCKQMMTVKEEQCTQLKSKLDEIEASLAERELKLMSSNLRAEYERQLGNIRQLRELYDERQRISAAEHENLQRLVSIKRDELKAEQEKTKIVEERNQTLLKELENANKELSTLREECNEHKFEKKALKEEMGAVNMLFSQMVTGFNGRNNLDIDRLTTMLEENRTLLNDMATKEMANDGATLPKLLFELVEQAAVASGKTTSRSVSPLLNTEEIEETVTNNDDDDDGDYDDDAQVVKTVDNAAEANVATNATNMEEVTAISESVVAMQEDNIAADVENDDDGDTVDGLVSAAGGATATAICYGTSQEEETASLQASISLATTTTKTPATAMSTSTCTSGLSATNSGRKHYRRITPTNATDVTTTTRSGKTIKFAEPEVIGKVVSTQEIIGNLPKVWKVLMELLSHHKIERVQFEENGSGEDCYKSVQTPTGIKTELSVSKTYIKLKDLILEKKSLVKETNRLKTLNCHLEYRLNEQEKRLSTVSLELTKTWHLVGKMQRQHRQLHTQEQILRYQLQQKRRLLSELKDELEYCRRKWAAARAKNDESQEQCNDLRREFAKRKLEDASNSTESGYSDSSPPSEDETAVTNAPTGGCRRKILREMFEHTRKIKRMQSTSPRRAAYHVATEVALNPPTLLRCNSAPPNFGWHDCVEDEGDGDEVDEDILQLSNATMVVCNGAIPKVSVPRAASIEKDTVIEPIEPEVQASRIERLEKQCESLIQQVLETSDNRERLEIQLCHFQDEISPAQYPLQSDSYAHNKRLERMTRASSAPATGCLTPREEEYTRKRSERLGRLEEESRQLMSRIKRTADRGHYLRCSLDRIRRVPSREGSFESNTEEDIPTKLEQGITTEQETVNLETSQIEASTTIVAAAKESPLTSTEEAYTARRSARLQRLEEESRALLKRISCNNERGDAICSRLGLLHKQNDNNSGEIAGKAAHEDIETRINNIDRISENRAERLRILEEEGKALLTRLSNTSARGTAMINRIAEREQRAQAQQANKQAMSGEKSLTQIAVNLAEDKDGMLKESAEAAYIEPILNNVASASIASTELADSLIVTTTSSQRGLLQGAIPKTSKPSAQLSVSRAKANKEKKFSTETETESLEDFVKRLKSIPFPAAVEKQENERVEERKEKDELK